MHPPFEQICRAPTLPAQSATELTASGFAIIPGPLSENRLTHVSNAYDHLMSTAHGPDFKRGSTTTRMSDLLSDSSAFDDIFVHPPLLAACLQLMNQPFQLSSLLARTVRAGAAAQELHVDLPRGSEDAPLLGFILMVDPFRQQNGATRFVPGSHLWTDLPGTDRGGNVRPTTDPGEVLACGDPGTMILFNAAIWHGHAANTTAGARRSIQGYFVRRNVRPGFDFRNRLPPAAQQRMSPLARYLLALDESL